MKRSRWAWPLPIPPAGVGLALGPAILGIGLAVLLQEGGLPNPLLYLQADLGTLLLLLGLLLSISASGMVAVWARDFRQLERTVRAEQLRAAQAHHRFVERLEHELKNPLTAIQAGVANLADASTAAVQHDAAASVKTQVQRLGRLAADLRKLTELEQGPLECAAVDLSELLEEAVDLARQQLSANPERLVLSLPRAWPLPSVMGDRDLIFMAVYNLLDNALKFTQPGRIVEVRAFDDHAAVAMVVADKGPGVSPEELPLLFEELYRGKGARGVPGSGLGLALVQAVAERHSGTIAVRSQPGQGCEFTLRLPLR